MRGGHNGVRAVSFAAASVAVAVAVGLSACSASSTKADGGYAVPALPKSFDVNNFTLPFDSYQLTYDQLVRLDTDLDTMMSRCAADYGATLTYYSDYADDPSDKSLMWGGRFGTLTKQQASRYGYQAMPTGPTQRAGGFYPNDPDSAGAAGGTGTIQGDAEQELISYGRGTSKLDATHSLPLPLSKTTGKPLPKGGCHAIVGSEMGGPLVSDTNLLLKMQDLSLNDSRTQAAVKKWSACMTAAGYGGYTQPQQPSEVYGILNTAEISLAVADVDCTTSSRWSTVYYEVLTGYEKEAVTKNAQLLQSVLASQKRALAKLEKLVAQ